MANVIEGTGSQFFPDQQVHAADLNNVQYASIQTLRNYLKGVTKTFGVYLNDYDTDEGLKVICNNDGSLLTINAGLGVDTEGRFIRVPTDPTTASGSSGSDPLYYPALPARASLSPGVTSPGVYYVNIYHDPLYSMSETDDSGTAHYTRVYDSYRIEVESTPTTTGLTLARANFNASGSLEQTTDSTGYLAGSGIRYALFDDRIGYEVYDKQKGDLQTSIDLLNIAIFNEELEKSAGFVFPASGHSTVFKIRRNATILRTELYMELRTGETGTATLDCYSGSTANSLTTHFSTLTTGTKNTFASNATDLNLMYQAGHPLKLVLTEASDTLTRATATIVYKRR